ncbi:hypothetical protein TU80_15300 [Pseudomonas veronii]|nr:hypothetical protein TU80_15300 [Pseudomonas veronii]
MCIGHFHQRFAPVLLAAYFDQAVFSVVGKMLQTPCGAAFFDQSAKAVIAVTLVLIGQQFVMPYPSAPYLRTVE